ncbi:CubicO group peptidase (beta-lactamase class C family) [Kribbella steppae]|uniref:CubicO group peptidase (Beta-lactamase class C family) n=1 Tax=Kribbella steppae TaxID=2512223 RepID=A0A4R2GYV3_9ACTN|nr:serine hydrolase domain-containing protein [Kribbella steppae]TCO16621.1 CubicO group peptidase (beta-lactamase class C family) [Kribbella steppae]
MSQTQDLLPDTPTPLSTNPRPPPGRPAPGSRILAVVRRLLVRDTASFAHGWAGKVLVAAVLIGIPATMVLLTVIGGRYGRYAEDSWKALLMLVVLAGSYLASRRLLLTVLIGALTVAVVSWVLSPNLADTRDGDPTVLAHLDHQAGRGMLAGYHDVAVAEIDLNAAQPVRLAGIGADDTTPMEIGSMTKAMTGLVIADAVRRGEIRMDAAVSTYLPQLAGSSAGTATMHELVTHTSGYAEFGAATLRRGAWKAPLGHNFLTADSAQLTKEAKSQTVSGRGRYAYSTLGSAIAGQAVAAAAQMSYADLMRTRLFEPLGMTRTAIEDGHALVTGGRSPTGLPVQPWVMSAYAPGAAAVSTAGDLAKLATALLDGTAPGMAALEPTTATDQSNSRIGDFWQISTWQTGQSITWHGGQTGGYASYLGLDRPRHKAVIVLSDVANDASDLGSQLLAHRK